MSRYSKGDNRSIPTHCARRSFLLPSSFFLTQQRQRRDDGGGGVLAIPTTWHDDDGRFFSYPHLTSDEGPSTLGHARRVSIWCDIRHHLWLLVAHVVAWSVSYMIRCSGRCWWPCHGGECVNQEKACRDFVRDTFICSTRTCLCELAIRSKCE